MVTVFLFPNMLSFVCHVALFLNHFIPIFTISINYPNLFFILTHSCSSCFTIKTKQYQIKHHLSTSGFLSKQGALKI